MALFTQGCTTWEAGAPIRKPHYQWPRGSLRRSGHGAPPPPLPPPTVPAHLQSDWGSRGILLRHAQGSAIFEKGHLAGWRSGGAGSTQSPGHFLPGGRRVGQRPKVAAAGSASPPPFVPLLPSGSKLGFQGSQKGFRGTPHPSPKLGLSQEIGTNGNSMLTSGMRSVSFFSQSCKLSLSAKFDFTKEQQ